MKRACFAKYNIYSEIFSRSNFTSLLKNKKQNDADFAGSIPYVENLV